MKPYCSHCKTKKGPFIKNGKTRNVQFHLCLPCNTARLKGYRAAHPEKIYEIVQRYNRRNPQRVRAWYDARNIKLTSCFCGEDTNLVRHHDDPRKTMDVIILCRYHHSKRHQELRLITA